MKQSLAAGIAAAIVAMVGMAVAQDAPPPDAAHIAKARGAIKGLGEELKARLVEALKAGGPVNGVEACNKVAQTLTAEVSKAQGVSVRRTALKVRNPTNAASAREKAVMENFVAQLKAGADIAKLDHAEIVTDGGAQTLVYMKAIPMAGEPCALCHGTEVKPDVAAAIGKLYPKDEATGFAPGELRGAFVVSMPMK